MSLETKTLPGLNDDEIAFYQEHGWLISSQVLPDKLLDDAERGLEQHWSGHRDRALEGANQYYADWMPGNGEGTRNNEYISLQNGLVSQ